MSKNHALTFNAETQVDTVTAVRTYRLAVLEEIIHYFKRRPTALWPTVRYIEWTPDCILHRRKSTGTVLEPCAAILKECGIDADDRLGSIMNALGFSNRHMHYLACACNGHSVSGDTMSRQLDFIANYNLRYV